MERLPRRPGQKEERYAQLLGEGEPEGAAPPASETLAAAVAPPPPPSHDRVAELEERVDALAGQVEWLRKEVVALRDASREREGRAI